MSTIILTFAKGNPRYIKSQRAQEISLKAVGYTGAYRAYFEESDIPNCPSHDEVRYGFKAYAIEQAMKDGYDTIIWLDSVVQAIGSLQPFIDEINRSGGVFFNNIDYPLKDWVNDDCLGIYGLTRKDIENTKQIMACCFGVNVKTGFGNQLMRGYIEGAKNGAFNGDWGDHRHDQSVISLLLNNDARIVTGHETFFIYEHMYKAFDCADTISMISK